MNKNSEATLPSYVIDRVIGGSMTRNILLVVAGSLLIAAAARVAVPIPFSPVPMTLQTLAVILVGASLGSRRGGAAALLYLLEGAMGLPVFSHPAGLAGPTAGYLLAFPLAAYFAGFCTERGWMRSALSAAGCMAAAIALIHLGGWTWLNVVIGLGPRAAFLAGVAPFVVSDVIKIAIGVGVLPTVQKLLNR